MYGVRACQCVCACMNVSVCLCASLSVHICPFFVLTYRVCSSGEQYGPTFSTGDVVGCGWDVRNGLVFFTKNGKHLGTAFKNVYGKLFPCVGVNSRGASIQVCH